MQNEIKINDVTDTEFSKFRISEKTQETLKKNNINSLFQIQSATFDYLYDKNDLIGRDKTGSGKTLAFSLPILERMRKNKQFQENSSIRILIMNPTRELVTQTKNNFDKLKNNPKEFSTLSVFGGSSIERQITSLEKGVDVLVATPGRLIDLMERGHLDFSNLEVVIFDETDEMLKIGFQRDIEYIMKMIKKTRKNEIQYLMFSATVPKWVSGIAKDYMKKNHYFVNMVRDDVNQTVDTVEHLKLFTKDFRQKIEMISDFVSVYVGSTGRCIIFTNTKSNYWDLSFQILSITYTFLKILYWC